MTITPQTLLGGPRGRRFLLELALRSERVGAERDGTEVPLAEAVMSAAHDLDPVPGQTTVSFFGAAVRDEEPTPATPESVASRLDAVRLADVDQDTALRVFADVVVGARYWQEPEGDDFLAATPVVRAALGRLAEHVARSAPAVGWWSEPVARGDQHAVAWDADAKFVPARGATGAADRLVQWRTEILPTPPGASARPGPQASGLWRTAPGGSGPSLTG